MSSMSLRSLDFFRKLPRELTHGTIIGASISVLAIILIVVVVLMEIMAFFRSRILTAVILDTTSDESMLVRFQTYLHTAPCDVIDIGASDYFGNRLEAFSQSNPYGHVTKTMVSPRGQVLGVYEGNDAGDARDVLSKEMSKYIGSLQKGKYFGHVADLGEPISAPGSASAVARMLDHETFQSALQEFEFAMVDFYSPRCIWCRKFASTYEMLALLVKELNLPLGVYKVNCDASSDICRSQQLRGVPTLRLFANGSALLPDYHGKRQVHDVLDFIERKTNLTANASDRKDLDGADGCAVEVEFRTPRIPFTLRIFPKPLVTEFDLSTINMSHTTLNFQVITVHMGGTRRGTPYLRFDSIARKPMETHMHHVKIVPMVYEEKTMFGTSKSSYYFDYNVMTQRFRSDPELPEIRISVDITPNAILMERREFRRWYDLLTSLCAVIGGVYVMAKMFDTFIGKWYEKYQDAKEGMTRSKSLSVSGRSLDIKRGLH